MITDVHSYSIYIFKLWKNIIYYYVATIIKLSQLMTDMCILINLRKPLQLSLITLENCTFLVP